MFAADGVEIRVDTPTDVEIPTADRRRVRAMTRRIADQIRTAWAPGPLSGAALDARAGDCTEHALAFVAAAERAGYEARTAAGRVYVDGPDGPALALHAWAEVRIGARWIGADPALRQFPIDATHLKLGAWIPEVVAADPDDLDLLWIK